MNSCSGCQNGATTCSIPACSYSRSRPKRGDWSAHLAVPFYEVLIETNGHNISLVFSDLIVSPVDPGYVPFAVPHSGPNGKFPLD
jgi:hypothetical protein